jgi:hypothetical protein
MKATVFPKQSRSATKAFGSATRKLCERLAVSTGRGHIPDPFKKYQRGAWSTLLRLDGLALRLRSAWAGAARMAKPMRPPGKAISIHAHGWRNAIQE